MSSSEKTFLTAFIHNQTHLIVEAFMSELVLQKGGEWTFDGQWKDALQDVIMAVAPVANAHIIALYDVSMTSCGPRSAIVGQELTFLEEEGLVLFHEGALPLVTPSTVSERTDHPRYSDIIQALLAFPSVFASMTPHVQLLAVVGHCYATAVDKNNLLETNLVGEQIEQEICEHVLELLGEVPSLLQAIQETDKRDDTMDMIIQYYVSEYLALVHDLYSEKFDRETFWRL